MTTETTQNGTQGDTTVSPVSSTSYPTPKSSPRSNPKPKRGERNITVDDDVAEYLNRLAKKHRVRIRDIVRVGAPLADERLGEPEPEEDGAAWAERMLRDRR